MNFYNQDSPTVAFYGNKILNWELTMEQVPNIFNLRTEVQIYVDARLPEAS